MAKSHIRQLANFVRAFGVYDGIRIWCSLFAQSLSPSRKQFVVQVPGIAAPLHLRKQDLPIFWQIMVMEEYDLKAIPQTDRVKSAYEAVLFEGKKPVIIDCGGHVGLSAVWFANRYPKAIVYVVEPDESNLKMLEINTAFYSNIVPIHGAVWGHRCNVMISNPDAGNASFRIREEESSSDQCAPLAGYTIDEISEFGDLRSLFLVKIDVEGAEGELFEGRAEWLQKPALVIIELHDWLLPWQGTSRSLFRKLGENNFDVVIKGENLLLFKH